MLTTAIPANGL